MDNREYFELNRKQWLYKLDNGCINCKSKATHLHHIVPLSLGGSNNDSNIVPMCEECHGIVHGINGFKNHSKSTKEGMKIAKANGKQIGRAVGQKVETKKSIEAKKTILKHSKKFNGTLNDKEVMAIVGVAKATYYRYVKEIMEEQTEA